MSFELPNIVIDTNVLFAALKSSRGNSFQLLRLFGHKRFVSHVSVPLVAEYESVLKRGQLALSPAQIDDVLDYVCAESVHPKIFYLWRPALKDANDDFVLELAVKAQAMIVSWNVKDFTRAESFGIRVVTPRDFLISLEEWR